MDLSSSSSGPTTGGSSLPPAAPKKSFFRRVVPFLLAANVAVGAPTTGGSSLPPAAPKKSFFRRVVPFLLAANVAVAAYVYLTSPPRDKASDVDNVPTEVLNVSLAASESVRTANQSTEPSPFVLHPVVSDDEQRELFKWILQEKRKVKTKDRTQKQQIDEEKALLKHYIRSVHLPTL